MDKQQEIQKKYLELQNIEQQIKQLQQQIILLNQQLLEFMKLTESIDDFKKLNVNAKAFITLGSGIYAEAELKNINKLLVNVGADVSIIKTPDEVKEMINKQISDVRTVVKKTEEDIQKIISYAVNLQEELKNLVEK